MTILRDVSKRREFAQPLLARIAVGLMIATAIYLVIAITLVTLSEPREIFQKLEQSDKVNSEALGDISCLRINGEVSSSDWIQVRDGRISVTGFLIDIDSGFRDGAFDPQSHLAASIIIPERVGGVIVYHLIPFFHTVDTAHTLLEWDDRIDNIDDTLILERNFGTPVEERPIVSNSHFGPQLVRVDLSIHDGWLHADHIGSYWNFFYLYGEYSRISPHRISGGGPDYVRTRLESLSVENGFWLDVSESETVEMQGMLVATDSVYISVRRERDVSNSLPDGEYVRVYLRAPIKLGTVMIYHLVPIYFFSRHDAQSFLGENIAALIGFNITVPVTVYGDALIFSED